MTFLLAIVIIAFIDLAGRIGALAALMNNGKVKRIKYRTWVLLCVFVNFAWIFYFILGREKKDV